MEIRNAIESLYPGTTDAVLSRIDELLDKYNHISPPTPELTSRDAILITYGDAIREDGKTPLASLDSFSKSFLESAISAIHLLPCFPFTSDDGFSVTDYYQIDPDLGDWDDVKRLGESFDLMFDAVVNHISKSSSWFQGFLEGDPAYQDYFFVADPSLDYSSVTRPRALPLLHPFLRNGETVHVWTTFSEDQVDLNYRSPDVFIHVLDVLLFYVSKGAKFIRLDAIAFIWKRIGTSCIHLDEVHTIIQVYKTFIDKIAPGVAIITETNVPHAENISYFGDGTNEAKMVYNFTLPPLLLHALHQEDVEVLTSWASQLSLPSNECCFFNFTASHDGVGVRPLQGIVSDDEVDTLAEIARSHGGFVSMRDNGDGTQSPYEINCNYLDFATSPEAPTELRVQRFLLTQSVMLAMPGVPGIYYHSLLGSENDCQSAIDSGINRRINRAKLDASGVAEQLRTPETLRNLVFTRYKSMLEVRRAESLFAPFGNATFESQGKVFIVRRSSDASSDQLMAVHNFSSETEAFTGFAGNKVDLLTGETFFESCQLKPFEFRWLK
ncbi:MAG: sugar phosphorylase [Planctomycetota bacterium]